MPEEQGASWPVRLAALLMLLAALVGALSLTWVILRCVAERYPRKVLLCAECVVLLIWWRESLQWLGVPDDTTSGLMFFAPIATILLIFFDSLNRRNTLREVPSIIVGEFAPASAASEAPHHDEAALVTNIVTKRVAQCMQAAQRPTTVPGAPAEFDFAEGMAPAPDTGWVAIVKWLLRLFAPARCWDVVGTVLRQGDQWLILFTVRDRAIRREVLTDKQKPGYPCECSCGPGSTDRAWSGG